MQLPGPQRGAASAKSPGILRRKVARRLRRRRPKPGDTWHLDEVFIRINGVLHYLWRAVDQHGVVLDIFVQDRRNAAAAKRFFKHFCTG
jgi:putative transposase